MRRNGRKVRRGRKVPKTRSVTRKVGAAWESRLTGMHKMYMSMGRAYVQQTGPPSKVTGKRDQYGRMLAAVMGVGPPDYLVVCKGRALVYDAKRHEGDLFPLQQLVPHQAAHLDAAITAGALAGVMLLMADHKAVAFLSWEALGPIWRSWYKVKMGPTRAKKGTASLTLQQIRELATYYGTDCDYLDTVFGAPNG